MENQRESEIKYIDIVMLTAGVSKKPYMESNFMESTWNAHET
jgi:hypothetical protein